MNDPGGISTGPAGDVPVDAERPAWWDLDHIVLTTAGIDIGSATSHVVLSEIECRRQGDSLSSRFDVERRTVRFRSVPLLTPYRGDLIDGESLRSWVIEQYQAAGIEPGVVDTGAVILTGEAIRRRNAEAIAETLSALGGRFVVTAAGHHMEAMLAAHGSGAVARSRDEATNVLNVDVGGGTTKFAVIDRGVVVATAALRAGGRLVAFDAEGVVERLEPAGKRWFAEAGVPIAVGDRPPAASIERVARRMADAIAAVAEGRPSSAPEWALVTEPIGLPPGPVSRVFSGGVMEHINAAEPIEAGDIGATLAMAVDARLSVTSGLSTVSPSAIFATVIGASSFAVALSGSTIYVSDPDVLPVRGVPVVRPPVVLSGALSAELIRATTRRHLARLDLLDGDEPIAFAIDLTGEPSFERLEALASGLGGALEGNGTRLVCFVFSADVGRNFGLLVKEGGHYPGAVVSVDGVDLREFDSVDIGVPAGSTGAVPMAIKSLVFDVAQDSGSRTSAAL